MVYPYKSPHSPNGRYRKDGKKTWPDGFIQKYRDSYIREFEKASSGLRGVTPKILNRDEWWALGRHYGLITPLLDWTEKPFIAAFFALTELWVEMNRAICVVWNCLWFRVVTKTSNCIYPVVLL